jgi:hypothetical protein
MACSLPLLKHYDPSLVPLMADSLAIAGEPAEQKNLRGYGRNLKAVVRHVRSNSSEEDTIFVWGFYPQVYLLTDRKPATRFSYCIYLTGLVPWVNVHPHKDTSRYIVPGSWDLLMSDLEKNKPRFIIDTSPGDIYYWGKYPLKKFPRLKSYLDEHYVLDTVVKNRKERDMFHIYRRLEG